MIAHLQRWSIGVRPQPPTARRQRFACSICGHKLWPVAYTSIDSILTPGDPILAIDLDPPGSSSDYVAIEGPSNVLDGNPNTKYLNFGQTNSGFILTPSVGPTIVKSFQMTTANDAVTRDPSWFELYGTNDRIVSTDNLARSPAPSCVESARESIAVVRIPEIP